MTDTSTKAVKRFTPGTHNDGGLCMRPLSIGGWVRHEDYAALVAERDALRDAFIAVSDMTDKAEDLACVLFFLAGAAHENEMHHSWTGAQALNAACRLLDVDRKQFIAAVQAEQSKTP